MASAAAVLVDEHLLDSFLTLAALRPDRAYAIHATRYAAQAERLRQTAQERLGLDVTLLPLRDHFDVRAIGNVVRTLPPETIFDITGGTGLLSAATAAVLREDGRPPSNIVTLDEHRRQIVAFDGRRYDLHELIDAGTVTVQVVLDLAGLQPRDRHTGDPPGFRRADDVRAMSRHCLLDEGTPLSVEHTVDWDAASAVFDPAGDRGLRAHADPQRRWANFLQGGWLESFTFEAVRAAGDLDDVPDLMAEVIQCSYLATKMEFDVIAIVRFRPHLLSCITSTNRNLLNHHLFEVEHRADLLGGAAVRPALITLAKPGAGRTAERMEAAVALEPPQLGMARVFGAPDLRGWCRGLYDGDRAGLAGLAGWLTEDPPAQGR